MSKNDGSIFTFSYDLHITESLNLLPSFIIIIIASTCTSTASESLFIHSGSSLKDLSGFELISIAGDMQVAVYYFISLLQQRLQA